jgi:hypothetical protein
MFGVAPLATLIPVAAAATLSANVSGMSAFVTPVPLSNVIIVADALALIANTHAPIIKHWKNLHFIGMLLGVKTK